MFFHYPRSKRGSPVYPSPPVIRTNRKLSGRRQPTTTTTTDTVAAERFTRNGKFMFFSRANAGQLRLRIELVFLRPRRNRPETSRIDFSFDLTIRRSISVDVSAKIFVIENECHKFFARKTAPAGAPHFISLPSFIVLDVAVIFNASLKLFSG